MIESQGKDLRKYYIGINQKIIVKSSKIIKIICVTYLEPRKYRYWFMIAMHFKAYLF